MRLSQIEVREEDEASLMTERVFEDLDLTQRIKYLDEIEVHDCEQEEEQKDTTQQNV